VVGQSGNLTPADKKLYALRDVTATVDSMPMIVGSIMSKKIAAGSDCILLDVKTGSGAFMKTVEDATTLGRKMVDIGKLAGRSVQALVTDMDIPLGNAIGNSLEVIESVNTLKGNGPEDLTYICKELSATMLNMVGVGDYDECMRKVEDAIISGRAFDKLVEMVENQNGDSSVIKDVSLFEKASIEHKVIAKESGYVGHIDSEKCGIASVVLEAGRETKESDIDYASGLILNKKLGDKVEKGDVLATLYTNNQNKVNPAENIIYEAYKIDNVKPEMRPLILAKIK
jgi:pyrimidine-nucleoside phosphorylase